MHARLHSQIDERGWILWSHAPEDYRYFFSDEKGWTLQISTKDYDILNKQHWWLSGIGSIRCLADIYSNLLRLILIW